MVPQHSLVPRTTSVIFLSRIALHAALFAGFAFGLLALPLDTAWAAKKATEQSRALLAKKSCGKASWYALDGRTTANGETMSSKTMTAAHKHLPFGTKVRVTNKHNGKSAVVRINDRGPFIQGRVIDVTPTVARKLGFRKRGHADVSLKVVSGKRKGKPLCA